MTLAPGSRLGPYEILSRLGAGGMGEVWKGRDTRLGREVAIKVLPPDIAPEGNRLKRFELEARAASSLSHPNIVTVFEVERLDGSPAIVMELVEGRTLREAMADGPVSVRKILQIAPQIAEGLARAHASGIVHRDLKPENVMITSDGLVKILDFGLAKLSRPEEESSGSTPETTVSAASRPGLAMGTVSYMSPEQASGHPVDFRSDQFALGSMLYEMASGRPAFRRPTTAQTLAAIIEQEPEPLSAASKTPAPLRWVIDRCLTKEPKGRYASTEDLARELSDARDRISEISSGQGVPTGSAPPWPIRRWLPLALALASAAMLAWILSHPTREGPPLYRKVSFRRGSIFGARFAPDGQTIVYGGAWEGKPSQLFLTRSDSTDATPLALPSANILSISSSGRMAILLLRDPPTLADVSLAGGAPREILDDPSGLSADWSPDGLRLAVSRGGRLEYPVGHVLYPSGLTGPTGPRFSPDGRLIAFVEGGIYEEQSIDVVDVHGVKKTLKRGLEYTLGLAWHPGTGEVWFSGRERRGGSYGGLVLSAVSLSGRTRVVARVPESLVVCDISKAGRVLLTHSEFRKSMMCLPPGASKEVDLSWLDFSQTMDLSDDGRAILFDEAGTLSGRRGGVYLRRTDGSVAVRLGEGSAAALSPDGKWAISIPPELDRLVLLPTGAGEVRTVRGQAMAYAGAKWFPDGRRILFAASVAGHPARLYVQDVAGSASSPLTPEGFDLGPVSPDGKLVATRGPDGRAFLYPVDGGAPRPIAEVVPGDTILRWNREGDALFVASGVVPIRIDRLLLSSRRRELVREIAPADPSGIIESAVRLTPDGESYAYSYLRDIDALYVVDGLR